eukprot:1600869-Alexandrium_andersonii.AAC.1
MRDMQTCAPCARTPMRACACACAHAHSQVRRCARHQKCVHEQALACMHAVKRRHEHVFERTCQGSVDPVASCARLYVSFVRLPSEALTVHMFEFLFTALSSPAATLRCGANAQLDEAAV